MFLEKINLQIYRERHESGERRIDGKEPWQFRWWFVACKEGLLSQTANLGENMVQIFSQPHCLAAK